MPALEKDLAQRSGQLDVPAHGQLPARSMQGPRREVGAHTAPETREVPDSALPHKWDFVHSHTLFSPDSIAFQDPRFSQIFESLEGRRRPLDTLITERQMETVSYVMSDGKVQTLTPSMVTILSHKGVHNVGDFYNLTSERLHELVSAMGENGSKFIERMQQYTKNLLILPQLQAVTLVLGSINTPVQQYAIPKDEEPRVIASLEQAMKRFQRLESDLPAHIFMTWCGWRDGVIRSIETVRNLHKQPDGSPSSTTTITKHLDTVKRTLSSDKLFSSMVTLPENSLGRKAGAVVMADLPGEGDIPLFRTLLEKPVDDVTEQNLRLGLLQILRLANINSFVELARVVPGDLTFLSQEDRLQIETIFHDILGPDPLGVKRRKERQQQWNHLELARRIDETNANKLLPNISSNDVAKIAHIDIREVVGHGIYHPILLGYPWPSREVQAQGDTPQERIFNIWELGEREVRERRLTILDILELPEEKYIAMRRLGEAKIRELKKSILALLTEQEQAIVISATGVNNITEYLAAREEVFFLDPTRTDEEYQLIQRAKQDSNLAIALLQTDIDLLERRQQRYRQLYEVAPSAHEVEDIAQKIHALSALAEKVLRPQQEAFSPDLQEAMRTYEALLRQYEGLLRSPKLAEALEYRRELTGASKGIEALRGLQKSG